MNSSLKLRAINKTGSMSVEAIKDNQVLFDLALVRASAGNDQEFIKKLITIFIETMPASVSQVATAARNKDLDLVRKSAHKIKSSIELMGIHSLKSIIHNLEFITEKDGDLNTYIKTLESTISEVIGQFKQMI